VLWEKQDPAESGFELEREDARDPVLVQAARELHEYFAGERREFSVPLDFTGTEFQNKVWRALRAIPFGETRSYGELAAQIGAPKASRAVGAANGRNPIPIILPCHRVIGSSGSLTGFGGGLPMKKQLLAHEQVRSQLALELR
jgi:methylated-DNA-[protein]-cysteine S-methyltransferase